MTLGTVRHRRGSEADCPKWAEWVKGTDSNGVVRKLGIDTALSFDRPFIQPGYLLLGQRVNSPESEPVAATAAMSTTPSAPQSS